MKRITVLLAEDHAMVREGLRSLLAFDGEIEVVGEAATGRQAVDLAGALYPNVVVMDIAMPLLNGFEATRHIRRVAPATRVLVLSAYSDDEFIAHMAAVGASGYVMKRDTGRVLVEAIKEISNGRPYFSPSIARRPVAKEWKARAGGQTNEHRLSRLSPREAEVLQLVAEGAATKQIAAALGISVKTVEKHRHQVTKKLDIHDIAGLARHAIATGVVESSTQRSTELTLRDNQSCGVARLHNHRRWSRH